MKVNAEDLIKMLQKMDEVEEKAGVAFSSCSSEDLQMAVEKMRELRTIVYGLLSCALQSKDEDCGGKTPLPCPGVTPIWREVPWWDLTRVTCGDSTKG